METLQGTVDTITYRNEENGYSVLRVSVGSLPAPVSCVGIIPGLQRGECAIFSGEWEQHRKFGRQFSVSSYETVRPATADGVLRLLESGFIPHIGGVRARRIVETFGGAALDVLDRDIGRLREVPGIGRKTAAKIAAAWESQKAVRSLMLFLQEFGVTPAMAFRIYRRYGANARQVVTENPYRLVEDVWGIGFKRADDIATRAGLKHDSPNRVRAGLLYLLQEAASDGHCYLPQAELIDKGAELLAVERALVVFTLDHCAAGRNVILEEECVYLPLYYNAEVKVAAILGRRLRAGGCAAGRFDDAEFGAWLARHAHRTGWQADPAQADACRKALQNPVFILTGGPGTGKTTTLQVIVSFLREHKVTIALAAPTGRAAQRMGNVAGFQAQTLHRLLEYRPDGDGFVFGRNAANPLEAGVVIVDEVSMVDLLLMRSLLEALPDGAALILVGDSNQLPSVGAGNVLADLIASRAIVHVELTTIFRQAVRSRIVTAAHQIIRGDAPSFANGKDDNCFFLTVETPQECLDTVIDLVCTRLPARYGFHPVRDIQVLTPMHRGILGTQNINALLQARLNPAGDRMERGETVFAAGDKVMQARNNYDQGVFNGDIGYIDVIDEERRVRVDYEGKTVWYEPKDLEQIVHAYCISIHKSQGCEFRAAVIPVMTQHYIMLQRNLIYTALTRARELCVFAGTYRALRVAVDNPGSLYRFSRLARRLVSPSRPDAAK